MRRFVVRFFLGILAAWAGSFLIPGVSADRNVTTFILMGLFLAIGEVALPILEGGAAVLLFFLPRSARVFFLRAAEVAIAASLVTGFGFSGQPLVGLAGLTVLLSLLYMLPWAH